MTLPWPIKVPFYLSVTHYSSTVDETIEIEENFGKSRVKIIASSIFIYEVIRWTVSHAEILPFIPRETRGFLVFSGGIEIHRWHGMGR